MSQVTTHPETLSPTRRALLELLLKEKSAVAPASDRIPRRPPSRETPLSFAQQQMWFLDQFAPGSSHYNFPLAFRFKGKLNLDALDRTLNEIVRRHEILRATYDVREGTPVRSSMTRLRRARRAGATALDDGQAFSGITLST